MDVQTRINQMLNIRKRQRGVSVTRQREILRMVENLIMLAGGVQRSTNHDELFFTDHDGTKKVVFFDNKGDLQVEEVM